MWPAPDDAYPTPTSAEQAETERVVFPLVQPFGGPHAAALPRLRCDEHAAFLLRILEPLPAPYVAFDANRAWLIYWVAHSLDLMRRPLDAHHQARAISTLLHFQDPHGGFGGGPGQMGHLMSTYAAVCALAIVGGPGPAPTPDDLAHGRSVDVGRGGWDAIDKRALYTWMLHLKQPDGSFVVHEHGEIDVRATYCVVVVASLLGLATDALLAGTGAYLASCQTYEGGFAAMSSAAYTVRGTTLVPLVPVAEQPAQGEAHGGYAFCAFASHLQLALLGRAGPVAEGALLRWASSLQGTAYEGGGFRGRTNKLVDGCYGWFCGGGLMTCLEGLVLPPSTESLDEDESVSWDSVGDADDDLFDRQALATFVLAAAQAPHGGLRDKPGKRPDAYHTCYNLSGLAMAQQRIRRSASAAACAETVCRRTDALQRACYAQSLGWAPTVPAGADALQPTHPVFNLALGRVERLMAYMYT